MMKTIFADSPAYKALTAAILDPATYQIVIEEYPSGLKIKRNQDMWTPILSTEV